MTTAAPPFDGALPYDDAAPTSAQVAARTRRLVLRYTYTSTLFLVIAGTLGVILRMRQAEVFSIDDNLWYALMTAHGLGAFVAWAGFFLMGVTWWVLMKCGFPIRNFFWAESCYWTMVIGTLGIVITTLFAGFAGSWVFLYPLPFFPAGQWGDAATGFFCASVLFAGLSILAYCVGVLHSMISPAIKARKDTPGQRIGLSLGLGALTPSRFKTDLPGGKVPYPTLPFTVNAIDMFLATLPFAVLLVLEIIKAIYNDFDINTLLAGNLLWAFGHPVVYLLLFPAAATYYYLIPRFAKRELVAGRVVTIAWLVALAMNVLVWAHHLYFSYPDGTPVQTALNTIMQPTTYSLVLPSALSLFSIAATVYRSNFEWTAASRFLIGGVVGWLVAGLQGVINATSYFDEQVHNTMWIVGHFHNMAFLNMGFLIFGAMYAFFPEWTGRKMYSERLGNIHFWGMVIGGYGWVTAQMIQGLQGAPRRWAVEPESYLSLTRVSLVFVLILVASLVLAAYNFLMTLRQSPFEAPGGASGTAS